MDCHISLNAMQGPVIRDHTSRDIFVVAGKGSGKSRLGIEFALSRSMENPPECMGLAAEPTYGQLDTIMLPEFQLGFARWNASYRYNVAKKLIVWGPENRRIWLRSADNPMHLDGPTLAWCWLDEAAQTKPDTYKRLHSRVRDKRASLTQRLFTGTPEGTNTWVNALVKKIQASAITDEKLSAKVIRGVNAKGVVRSVVYGSTYDNKHNLSAEYIEDMEELYEGDAAGRQNNIMGIATAPTGSIYTAFSVDNLRPCLNPGTGRIVLGWDFNVGHMVTTVGTWFENRQVLHIWGEVVGFDTTTDEHAARVFAYLAERGVAIRNTGRNGPEVLGPGGTQVDAFIDASGRQRHSSAATSDRGMVSDAGFWARHDNANPLVRNRIAAVQRALKRRKLLIDPVGAPSVAQAVQEHGYDKNGDPQKKWADRQLPLDHYADALGYQVWGLMPVMSVAGNERGPGWDIPGYARHA